MFFELRQYRCRPGKRDEWVKFMDEEIIPYQVKCGMVILGAFVAALLSGEFRISTFSEPGTPSVWRYTAGSVLMGFGGILAVGCTVGAGFTGGSVLAVSSLLGLAAMMTFCAATDTVLRRLAERTDAKPSPVPAE